MTEMLFEIVQVRLCIWLYLYLCVHACVRAYVSMRMCMNLTVMRNR